MFISIVTIFATIASEAAIADSIITGIGLGSGLYCASRTKQTKSMPKKAR